MGLIESSPARVRARKRREKLEARQETGVKHPHKQAHEKTRKKHMVPRLVQHIPEIQNPERFEPFAILELKGALSNVPKEPPPSVVSIHCEREAKEGEVADMRWTKRKWSTPTDRPPILEKEWSDPPEVARMLYNDCKDDENVEFSGDSMMRALVRMWKKANDYLQWNKDREVRYIGMTAEDAKKSVQIETRQKLIQWETYFANSL